MGKKSLEDAKRRAKRLSIEHPEVTVRVMDKKGCKAVITTSEWVRKERCYLGYSTVLSYKAGEEVAV